jgi:hypothetical protein
MMRGRLALAMLFACAARAVAAQSLTINFSATEGDSISPAPVISVAGEQVPPDAQPATIQLLASLEPQFRSPFMAQTRSGSIVQFQLDSLLPERTVVYFRATLIDRFGVVRASRDSATRVRSWLRLTFPARPTNSLFTRTPRFEWNSPGITLPPGPWQYSIAITNSADGKVVQQRSGLGATSFVADALEACTSYRWSVTATSVNSPTRQSVTVQSIGTFGIFTAECPSATVLFQNFPNPFSDKTCLWFDLAHRSAVKLTIYDVRLREVRRMVPSIAIAAVLDSGAYGRESPTDLTGCDPNLQWDGRDDRGRLVPSGVYIAILEADGRRDSKKMMFIRP